MSEMESDREKPWNFHTCRSCPYRSKSAFVMCKHVRLHKIRPKTDTFVCDTKTPEKFECEYCDFETNFKVNLCEHFRVCHEENELNVTMEKSLSCFQCPNCDFETYSLLVFLKHTDDCQVQEEVKNCLPSQHSLSIDKEERLSTDDDSDYQPTVPRKLLKNRWRKLNFEDSNTITTTFYDSGNSTVDCTDIDTQTSGCASISASFSIDLQSRVDFTTHSVLHKGLYKCNAINGDSIVMGFINSVGTKATKHECIPPPQDPNVTHIVIKRGSTGGKITIQSEFCIPPGKSQGREVFFANEFYTAALRVSHASTKSIEKNRTKGKQHYCAYCGRMAVRMSKHLMKLHANEKEIAEVIKMPVNSKERIDALKKIRIRGDAKYNMKASLDNRIVIRRGSISQVKNAVECTNCKSLLAAINFARHERRCTGRPANYRKVLAEARRANFVGRLEKPKTFKQKSIEKLINPIKSDMIRSEIESDFCLRLATERYAMMQRTADAALQNDRQHLRRLARLLLEIKKIDPTVTDYKHCILFCEYDVLLEGVFRMCKLNTETKIFEKPALAHVLSSEITLLSETLWAHYVEKGLSRDATEWNNLRHFISMHEKNYSIYIGRTVEMNRQEEKE